MTRRRFLPSLCGIPAFPGAILFGMLTCAGMADGIRLVGPVLEIANDNNYYNRASYSPAEDHYLVLWNRAESPNLRLVGRCINASTGQLAGPRFQVGPNAGIGTPVYNPDQGNWFVVYGSDADIGADLYAQKVGASGVIGGAIPLVEAASHQAVPHADYDFERKRYLVAWADYRPGKPEIRGRFFDPNGATITGFPEFTISEYSPKSQNNPMVVYNPSADEFMVAWVDARNDIYRPANVSNDNNYIDLYGQRVNAITGTLIGSNIPINSPYIPGSPYVGDGQDTLGGLVCDTTPGSAEYGTYFVYIQKLMNVEGWTTKARMLNANGTPRGEAFSVSHPLRGGTSGCVYNPSDDTWFTSYLDQNYDLVGQQFAAAGQPLRTPDALIAMPDWEENFGALAVRPSDGQYLQVAVKFENFVTHERPNIIEVQRFVRDATPPAPAARLTVVPGLRRATLHWFNPTAEDFTGTLIRMRSDRCPSSIYDGTPICDLPGTAGTADSFVHNGLTPHATYWYAVFTHDDMHNWAAGACVSVTLGTPGDIDVDGDVDQSDFGYFQSCLSVGGIQYSPGCEDADLDGDGDVDSLDGEVFRQCMSGPSQPPGC